MVEMIEFRKRARIDLATNARENEVVVLRDGCEVAALPEADRLDRALALSFEEAKWIQMHFEEIMRRKPTDDELEFWRAITDYRVQTKGLLLESVSLEEMLG